MKFTSEVTSFAVSETDFGAPRTSFWLDVVPALIEGSKNKTVVNVEEDGFFSELFNFDSTTADYFILGLMIATGVLFLCFIISCIVICARPANKSKKYVA